MNRPHRKKLLAASVLAGALALGGCGGGEERQQAYYDRAQELFEEGDYDKARIEVKNALQINANYADGRYLLALIDEKEQDWRSMYGNLATAIEIAPGHKLARIKLAQFLLAAQQFDDAREQTEEILKNWPDTADAIAVLSALALKDGDTAKATELGEKALALEPDNVSAIGVMARLYEESNPQKALALIDAGLQTKPDNTVLKLLKINLLSKQGKSAEVIALYQELIAAHPEDLLYRYQLINFHLADKSRNEDERKLSAEQALKQAIVDLPKKSEIKLWLVEFVGKNHSPEQAISTLEQYVAESPDSFDLRDALGKLYVQNDKIDQAKQLYRYDIDKDPTATNALESRNRLCDLAIVEQDFDKAKALIDEVLKIEAENSGALINRARIAMNNKDFAAAIPDLRVVLKSNPENVQGLLMLATAQQEVGDNTLALDNYQAALSLQPQNPVALVGAARILLEQNRTEEAQKNLELAATAVKGNPEITMMLTDLYSRQEDWQRALDIASGLLLNQKTAPIGHYLQGRTYLRKQDYEKAAASLEKSLAAEPSAVEALQGLIGAYMATNQADKAMSYVQAVVAEHPDYAHAQELLANLYLQKGDKAKAQQVLEALIASAPDRISTYTTLARIYYSDNNEAAVEKLYRQGLEKTPNDPTLLVMTAEFHQFQGDHKKAKEIYEDLLKAHPDAVLVKNNLAVLLMDHFPTENGLRQAQSLTADFIDSKNPVFIDTVGWLQYKLGNYPQALSLLQDAVKKGGDAPVYHYHLGMAYFKNDMKPQAKEQLQLALADAKAEYAGRDEAAATLKGL